MQATADGYAVDIPLSIYFDTEEHIEIRRVANSLLAMEQLAKRLPDFLSQLTSVEFGTYDISISKVQSGTMLEEVVLRFWLDDPENRAKFERFKAEHPKLTKAGMFTLGSIAAFLFFGQAYNILDNFLGNESPTINNSFNTHIEVAGDYLNMPPEQVRQALNDATSGNRKKLVQNVLAATGPVAGHQDAAIKIGGKDSELVFPKEAVKEISYDADLNATTKDIDYNNSDLQIVSLNRESSGAGWQGRIAQVGDKLLKLEFSDSIDMREMGFREHFKVDAVVTFRNDINHAALIAQKATITRVYAE